MAKTIHFSKQSTHRKVQTQPKHNLALHKHNIKAQSIDMSNQDSHRQGSARDSESANPPGSSEQTNPGSPPSTPTRNPQQGSNPSIMHPRHAGQDRQRNAGELRDSYGQPTSAGPSSGTVNEAFLSPPRTRPFPGSPHASISTVDLNESPQGQGRGQGQGQGQGQGRARAQGGRAQGSPNAANSPTSGPSTSGDSRDDASSGYWGGSEWSVGSPRTAPANRATTRGNSGSIVPDIDDVPSLSEGGSSRS